MRISRRERGNVVRIRLRPVSVHAYWGFGAAFIAIGLLILPAGRATELDCTDRSAGRVECRLESRRLSGLTARGGELSAAVTRDLVTWGFIASRDVFVTLNGRERALELVAAGGDEKDDLARRLNALLSGTGSSVKYREDSRPALWILALVTAAGGVVILISIENISVVIDRGKGLVTIRSHAWWRRCHETVPIELISGSRVEPSTFLGRTSWNVALELLDREPIPVARVALFTEASAAETAVLIEDAIRRAPPTP